MKDIELKLTTKRALEFEARTGKDLIAFLQEVQKTEKVGIRDVVELFVSCGPNYTVDMFDEWDIPFKDKVSKIMVAVTEYVNGSKTVAEKKSKK